jgi:plasmid stabilization system protein ParE
MPVTHGTPTITINHDHQFLVCEPSGTMVPTGGVGFFARDTRFVSSYSVTINGVAPLLLDASTIDHFSARHEFTTPQLSLAGTRDGTEHDIVLEERAIGFRLDRTIFEGIHEDYDLISFAPYPVRLILEVAIESDFADIFDVLVAREGRRVADNLYQRLLQAGADRLRRARRLASRVRKRPHAVRDEPRTQAELAHLCRVAAGDRGKARPGPTLQRGAEA